MLQELHHEPFLTTPDSPSGQAVFTLCLLKRCREKLEVASKGIFGAGDKQHLQPLQPSLIAALR